MTKFSKDFFSPTQLGWALVFLTLVILPFFNDIPTWPLLLYAITAAWRWWLLKSGRGIPNTYLRIAWTLVNSAYIFTLFGSFNGLQPGSALLIVMVSMKLLESSTTRDLLVLIFMAFFLILTQFLFDQSILMACYSVVSVWLGVTTLAQVNRKTEPPPVRQALKSGGWLLAQTVPITLVLFLLFPRVPGPFWALPNSSQGKTGLSDSMEPGSISQLLQSSEVAFRVSFDGQPPARRHLYWRGPVLENVAGRKWQPNKLQMQKIQISARGTPIRYDMVLEPHNKNWLLALEMPDPTSLPRNTLYSQSGQLLSQGKIAERRRVTLTAHSEYIFSPTLDESRRRINVDATQTRNPRTRALVETWSEQSSEPADVIDNALLHFNQQPFAYTLSPPELTTINAVDDFLFNSKRGFCEHYASSFVLMMRYAGIPARVVTGYMGGEFNPMSQHLTVRQSDAHAWAEVWLENIGWYRVDPTAAVAPERVENGIAGALPAGEYLPTFMMRGGNVITNLRQAIDALNANWNNWVLGYSKEHQWSLLRKLGMNKPDMTRLIAIMMTAIVILLSIYVVLLNRIDRVKPKDAYQLLYFKFIARLKKLGIQTSEFEDAVHLAQRAGDQLPEHRETIRQFCEVYQNQRYGPQQNDAQIEELRLLLKKIPRTLFAG